MQRKIDNGKLDVPESIEKLHLIRVSLNQMDLFYFQFGNEPKGICGRLKRGFHARTASISYPLVNKGCTM